MESWALIFLRLRVMAHGVVWWADAFPWKRWWCLAMIVVVSCCNLFLVGVWRWLLLFRVAICFSLRVVRFSFDFDTLCWICFSGCVCAFLVSRLAFVAICFSLRVFHNWTVMRFSSQFGICCVSVSVARSAFLVSCFAWSVSRFVSRVSAFLVSLWHLLFVSRCAYFRISYHNGVVERAIELLRVSRLTLWHLLRSCFALRVSRFSFYSGICGNFFLVTRMCFSFHFGIWRWSEAVQDGFFQRVVQDGVQECKSRCRARW